MATLDDKLMGEKLHYYCSSSEDEDEGKPKFIPDEGNEGRGQGWNGAASNTGPKGVIADWQRYKQLEKENREEQAKEKVELAKKLTLTCRTDREDEEAKAKEERLEKELEDLMDDDFMHDYMEKRMKQMIDDSNSKKKRFGYVVDLGDSEAFLEAIDKEAEDVVVLISIYDPNSPPCKLLLKHLDSISKDYPMYKFCKILSTSAGLSKQFTASGVPAILVYQRGDLMTNFVRLTDAIGEDFFAADVESYLVEHGVLKDKDLVPSIIKGPAVGANESDSD